MGGEEVGGRGSPNLLETVLDSGDDQRRTKKKKMNPLLLMSLRSTQVSQAVCSHSPQRLPHAQERTLVFLARIYLLGPQWCGKNRVFAKYLGAFCRTPSNPTAPLGGQSGPQDDPEVAILPPMSSTITKLNT